MSTIFRAGSAKDQKISRGQLLLGPVGGNWMRNVGNVIVTRSVETETVDIVTAEDPRLARLARVTTKQNEAVKIMARSANSVICALAYGSPQGETWSQTALVAGEATIPADAKDGQIYDFFDEDGNRVFNVVVTPEDQATAAIVVDEAGGSYEVIGDRTTVATFDFTALAVNSSLKLGFYRRLQTGEIRQRARFRENNAFGRNSVHDWPVLSIRMSGDQKLSDDGNEIQSVELDGAVEYDNLAVGRERGTVRELPQLAA